MGDSQLSLIPHFSDGFKKSRVHSRNDRDDRQRRRVYGGGFHTRMIKLERVETVTCFGASSHPHPDKIRSPKSS
uniref:Uncharacterized protein n=1 Tax=Brassica oleracea var. oleracea TaxID=109376 RepID=A0A0D3BGL0_BRAOL